jgi:hypothetical protein
VREQSELLWKLGCNCSFRLVVKPRYAGYAVRSDGTVI